MVLQESRLLPNSLRVIGFGHTCGGIMKEICESDVDWTSTLDALRALVSFSVTAVTANTSSTY